MGYSFDVKIEGHGVVRDGDTTFHNKKNTFGIVTQPGAPPPAPAAADEEELYEPCDICGKTHEPIPLPRQFGKHDRSRGSSSITANLVRKNNYGEGGSASGPPKNHPWYVELGVKGQGALDGHHLICVKSLDSAVWETLCKTFGYNVNNTHNGVMLPAIPQLACVLRKPYHRSSHRGGKIYDENGDIVPSVTYVDAVNQLIAKVERAANSGAFCSDPEGFNDRLKAISQKILAEVAAFRWTLTKRGINFSPGGKGCGRSEENIEGMVAQCPNHSLRYRPTSPGSNSKALTIEE